MGKIGLVLCKATPSFYPNVKQGLEDTYILYNYGVRTIFLNDVDPEATHTKILGLIL